MVRLKTMLLTAIVPTIVKANPKETEKKVAEALIKQFNVDKYFKDLEKKYIPKNIRENLGIVITTQQAINKGYLEFKWNF